MSAPPSLNINHEEALLEDQEILELLREGAVKVSKPSLDQFLSSTFLILKKDGVHQPVVKLKKLNRHVPYVHLKMEGLFLLKELLKKCFGLGPAQRIFTKIMKILISM